MSIGCFKNYRAHAVLSAALLIAASLACQVQTVNAQPAPDAPVVRVVHQHPLQTSTKVQEQRLKQAIQKRPNSSAAHLALGQFYRRMDRYQEAEQEDTRAFHLDPNSAQAHTALADVYMLEEHYGFRMSNHTISGRQRLVEQAVQEYQRAVELAPRDTDARLALNHTRKVLRDYYLLSPQLTPHGASTPDLAAAERAYRRALQVDPKDVEAHLALAGIYCDQHRVQASLQQFRSAIKLRPKDACLHWMLGEACLFLDDIGSVPLDSIGPDNIGLVNEAEHEFQQALRIDPKCAEARLTLSRIYLLKRRYVQMEQELKRCISIKNEHQDNNGLSVCQSLLAEAYMGEKHYAEALHQYQKLIRLYPQDGSQLLGLGAVYTAQKRYDAAEGAFRKALAAQYTDGAYLGLGQMYVQQQRYAEAEQAFKQAIAANGNHPEPYVSLGLLYSRQHRFAEAITEDSKALRLDPHNADALANLEYAMRADGIE